MRIHSLKRCCYAGITSVCFLTCQESDGSDLFPRSRQVVCDRCGIDNAGYVLDRVIGSGSLIASPSQATPTSFGTAASATNGNGVPTRRGFFPDRTTLTVNEVQLEHVAIAIYQDGQIRAQGRIVYSGPETQARVRITVSAFASDQQSDVLTNNRVLLWQEETTVAVRSGDRPRYIPLCGQSNANQLRVPVVDGQRVNRDVMNEVTHFEIVVDQLSQF